MTIRSHEHIGNMERDHLTMDEQIAGLMAEMINLYGPVISQITMITFLIIIGIMLILFPFSIIMYHDDNSRNVIKANMDDFIEQ